MASLGCETFHRVTASSDQAAARVWPSEVNASDSTLLPKWNGFGPLIAGRLSSTGWLGLVRFHRSTKPPVSVPPARPPTASVCPSGLNARARTELMELSSGRGAPKAAGRLGSETSQSLTAF